MNKSELRKKYKSLRKQLSNEEIEEKSLAIANQILKMDIWKYENYHIFLPIVNQKEVNTEYIMHILQGKDKNVIVSKSNFDDFSMEHFLLTDNTKINVNKWGIPEPQNGLSVNPELIDLVFVPLLAFDINGNRVGYGKGFYDKFLTNARPKKVIGLSFFPAEKVILDTTKTDFKLNLCVLPDKIYDFV